MLRLRSSVAHHRADEFGELLQELEGVRRVAQTADEFSADRPSSSSPTSSRPPPTALVEAIAELGIGGDDYVLTRVEVVAPLHRHLSATAASTASPGSRCSARREPTRGRSPATWR